MKRRIRILWLALALGLTATMTVGTIAASAVSIQHHPQESIAISNFEFSPRTLYALPGDLVRVRNFDGRNFGVPHSVTSNDGRFDTEPFVRGYRDFFAPNRAGVYYYFCEVHPFMTGRVIVVD